jgi:hypothetical protein
MLVLSSLLAGTSLACVQKGTSNTPMAEDCCHQQCQHAMTAVGALKCCQSHHIQLSQVLSLPSPAKTIALAASALLVALIPRTVPHVLDQFWVQRSIEERYCPSPPFYTLHCALLI